MELTYQSRVPTRELEIELDRIWAELQRDGALRSDALAAVPESIELLNRKRAEVVEIKSAGSGLSGAELLVILAPLLVEIARDLWTKVILPKIRQDQGESAIKDLPTET
jgi:hypothetical protein